jgi:hypothetical protein
LIGTLSQDRRSNSNRLFWFLIVGLLALLVVPVNLIQYMEAARLASAISSARSQLAVLSKQLSLMHFERNQETKAWEVERRERAEQRARDDEDKRDAEKRAKMHIYWDSPMYAPHCAAWGAREYTSKLNNVKDGYDLVKACERTLVTIHDNIVYKPDWCEMRVGIVVVMARNGDAC